MREPGWNNSGAQSAGSQQANSTRIHPCVQEEHTGKIPVASEDAQEGSVRLNPFSLGPGSGHVEEEGVQVQEADTAQVQTAEQKDPNNSQGRYSKADSWPPKLALSCGINCREVCCCCTSCTLFLIADMLPLPVFIFLPIMNTAVLHVLNTQFQILMELDT